MLLVILISALSANADEQTLLAVFENQYSEIMEAVNKGGLPQETGQKGRALYIQVRKDLINFNARLETLKLEAAEYDGARQQQALKQLVQVSGERERRIVDAIHALEALSGKRIDTSTKLAPIAKEKAAISQTAAQEGTSTTTSQERTSTTTHRILDIEIELGPEDLSKTQME